MVIFIHHLLESFEIKFDFLALVSYLFPFIFFLLILFQHLLLFNKSTPPFLLLLSVESIIAFNFLPYVFEHRIIVTHFAINYTQVIIALVLQLLNILLTIIS